MVDESGTVTIVLSSLDDVNKYHELPRKGRKTSSNAAFETFDPKDFDSNSKPNSFKTDQESLSYWLFAMKTVFEELDNYETCPWTHKSNKGQISELEIKFFDPDLHDFHLLTIHVYLSTALLHFKGPLLEKKAIIKDTASTGRSFNRFSEYCW